MSKTLKDNIKRWTVWRETALSVGIIQGRTTVSGVSRSFDPAPSASLAHGESPGHKRRE